MKTFTPVELAQYIIKGYYVDRDIDAVLDHCADHVTWIGPCEHEYMIGLDAMRAYYEAGRDDVPPCHVDFEDIRTVKNDGDRAIVMGRFVVRTDIKDEMLLRVIQRCTMIMIKIDDEWVLEHLHNSNIYEEMGNDTYFPTTVGHQTLEYMNEVLKQKTEVIDMISDNINGGLKGSNDDETYSFFYVNEGLCRMLGYTYDEFMEMSHGCAVGAVYPPDLPAALQACEEWFAKGSTYRAEYRIQKKDGSLIWVLDTGKKTLDSHGNTKINSIITDITVMKQAEIELKIERERYRIALENITDVMFDYDIEHGTLIKYEREEHDRNNPVKKVTIERYFDYLETTNYIHLDDIGTLKAYLCGILKEDFIDIRLYQKDDQWNWIRVTSSYVYDNEQQPVKCIGIWRNITEEKLKLDSLIDLSQRDALTHLYNLKTAEAIIRNDMQMGKKCAMMIMDIDAFKHINDTYGHLCGNQILLAITDLLKQQTQEEDLICRIGGDEFMIFMREERVSQIQYVANHILQASQSMKLDSCNVTLSIGICLWNHKDNYTTLFRKADHAMYIAKNSGKNQIHIEGEN